MDRQRITLQKEKETLLIPLYCRYLESKKESPIIKDEKAIEIVDHIEYDYGQLKIPKQTYITICLRTKQFDNYVKDFLVSDPYSIVIHLGCGLDSRFVRVDNGTVEWYDLDFPEVIELRKQFYQETNRYHFISSPVMKLDWLEEINANNKKVLILAEGLFMYLKRREIQLLFESFSNKFAMSSVIFDSYSEVTVKGIKTHPSIKKTGAIINWGINNAKDIESWSDKIYLKKEWYFTQSDEIKKLDFGYRILFRLMGLLPIAKNAHRILVFQIGES